MQNSNAKVSKIVLVRLWRSSLSCHHLDSSGIWIAAVKCCSGILLQLSASESGSLWSTSVTLVTMVILSTCALVTSVPCDTKISPFLELHILVHLVPAPMFLWLLAEETSKTVMFTLAKLLKGVPDVLQGISRCHNILF